MYNIEDCSQDILNELIKIFKNHKEKVTGYTDYRGRAIRISGKYNTNIWIRVEQFSGDKMNINISNIHLRPGIQRKGILTEICKMVSLKKYVQNVYIGSPTTDAIHKFAQKFGLEYDSRYTRYIVK